MPQFPHAGFTPAAGDSAEALVGALMHDAMRPPGTTRQSALIRGLRTLEAVAIKPRSAAEIGRLINVNRSSALRILRDLEAAHYVVRDPQLKTYSTVSTRLAALLGTSSQPADWNDLIDPILTRLRDEFGEATIASVPVGGVMVYASFFPSLYPLAVREQRGTARPMHASALGKAYLAALDEATLDAELGRLDYEIGTERAPHDPSELRLRLDLVRTTGFAVDHEETFWGVDCVAAAARIDGVLIGAIGVSGPSTRMIEIGHAVIGHRLNLELLQVAGA